MVSAAVCSNAVVLLVLIHCLLLLPLFDGVFVFWSMSSYAVLSLQSSFLIISLRKRELVASLKLSSCLLFAISVLCLLLTVLEVGLHRLIVVFLGRTHLHFGHSLLIAIQLNMFFCVSCLTVCQSTQTVNYLTTLIAIADLRDYK